MFLYIACWLNIGAASMAMVLLVVRYVKWIRSPLRRLPCPGGSFLLGVFPSIMREPYMDPHKRWWKKFGADTKMIYYTTVLGRANVLVLDKEIAKIILKAPAGRRLPRFRKNLDFVRFIIGDGLVTMDGEEWLRSRRILQPAFSTQFIRKSLNKSVPPKINRFIRYWQSAAESGREIDANSHFSAITLDIIGDVGFSYDFHGIDTIQEWAESTEFGTKPPKNNNDFIQAVDIALKPNFMSAFGIFLGYQKLDKYFNPHVVISRYRLDKAVERVLEDARKKSAIESSSLLHLMIEAKDPEGGPDTNVGLTEYDIKSEAKLFLLAGHETTSTWMYWASYVLATHPDVQERVYDNVVQYAPKSVSQITMTEVEKMEYLRAFLQEVLRLYPPAGLISRITQYPERFDGQEIPAGTRIALATHLLQRHPAYWDDPETFRPERWINVSEKDAERRRFAFLPFSAGGRNCIGQQFAIMEAHLLMAPLVRAFRFEIAPSQKDVKFTFTSFVTLKTKPDLLLTLKNRPTN